MSDVTRFERRDWLAAVSLFAVSLALRVPFRSQLVYHWDGAEFTAAITEFNLRMSQPHPPGYFLYVMLGRLVNSFVGDPHTSLVWMSVVFGSALPVMMYGLGSEMMGRRTGVAAGLFAMTSPQLWFHSEVALTYIVDGFLVCLIVWCCWRAKTRGGRWCDALLIGVLLAVTGGVREQTAPALVPLVIWAFWRAERQRVWKLCATALTAALLGLSWLVPMIQSTGGWKAYWEVVHRHTAFHSSLYVFSSGIDSFLWNVTFAAGACLSGLMLCCVLLVAGLLYRVFWMDPGIKRAWNAAHRVPLEILVIWVSPMLLLGTVATFTVAPGYVLCYLPAGLLAAAMVAASMRRAAFVVTVVLVCLVNTATSVAWPHRWEMVFVGMGRTLREVCEHDRQLRQAVDVIRRHYDPRDTVICHAAGYMLFGFRHFQLYLPEFDQYQLREDLAIGAPKERPLLCSHAGRLGFGNRSEVDGKQIVLLVVPPGERVEIFELSFDVRETQIVDGSAGIVFQLPMNGHLR